MGRKPKVDSTRDLKSVRCLFLDLDGTLITTASGDIFPKGLYDIKFKLNTLWKIKEMVSEGSLRTVSIISNQGGVEQGYVRKKDMEKKMEFVIAAINDFCSHRLELLTSDFASSTDPIDPYRKPNTMMIEKSILHLEAETGMGRKYIKENGLFVGDASGLPGQFSDEDKKCAENAGIDYMDIHDFLLATIGKDQNNPL